MKTYFAPEIILNFFTMLFEKPHNIRTVAKVFSLKVLHILK